MALVNQNNVSTARVYSGGDGMYYIPNVKAGSYTLEVWAVPNKAPRTFHNIPVVDPLTNVNPVDVH